MILALLEGAAAPVTPVPTDAGSGYIAIAPLLSIVAAFFGLAAAVMVFRNERLKGVITEQAKRAEKLAAFSSTVASTSFVETDIFFLGPRMHGKSGVVTAFARQWRKVTGLAPTATDFERFSWESPEYSRKSQMDNELGVMRPMLVRAKLNIYDYAGEDRSIESALELIGQSSRYIVVFVISAEPHPIIPSHSYFNLAAVKRLKKGIARASEDSLTTLVLFTKHDISEFSAEVDPEEVPDALLQRNHGAMENIQTIFGETKTFLVSSLTGFGVAIAVREILSFVVDDKGLPR